MAHRIDKATRPLQTAEPLDLDWGMTDDVQKLLVRPNVGLERGDVEVAQRNHRTTVSTFRCKPRRHFVEKL
jgi:hypothetical protein